MFFRVYRILKRFGFYGCFYLFFRNIIFYKYLILCSLEWKFIFVKYLIFLDTVIGMKNIKEFKVFLFKSVLF